MPGRDPISQLGDLEALQAQTDKIVEMVTQISGAIKSVPEIASAYKNSSGGADLKKNTEDLIAVNLRLTESMQKIAAMEAEIQALRSKGAGPLKQQSDEQIRASIQARAESKSRTDAIRAEGDAYKQLALEYNKAAAEAKKLQAVALKSGLKEDMEAAKQAAFQANSLSMALKTIDKSVGDTRRNVGNYKEALTGLERQLNATRHSMGLLVGLGDSAGSEMQTLKLRANALTEEIARLKEESAMAAQNIGGEGGMLGGLKNFGKQLIAQAAMFIGIYQAFEFFKSSIQEIIHAQQEASKLNNILRNIGRQDAFERLQQKAKGLAEEFKTFKSEDLVGVFDQLIVYGKLTEKQIDDLTPVIVNFSAQTGQSLEDSTSVIIKAMEGNARGLKEFGINIHKGGTEVENFGHIMTELKPRVEGAAQAFGETTAGQLKKTEVEIDELKKKIGEELEPTYQHFLKGLADGLAGLPQLFEGIGDRIASQFYIITDAAKTAWYSVKGFFTHDFSDLANFEAEKKKTADAIEAKKEQIQITRFAESFAAEASKKSLKDQQVLLQQNMSLLKQSAQTYADIVRSGKQNTAEGHRALLDLQQDEAIIVALQKQIAGIKDTRVLGVGGNDDVKKDFTDYEEGFRQLREEIQKFQNEAFGKDLDPYLKSLADLKERYQETFIKINDTRDTDLKKVKENAEKGIITAGQAAKLRVKIEQDTDQEKLLAEQAYYANLNALQEKERTAMAAKRRAEDERNFKEAVEQQKRMAKTMGDQADAHFREQVTIAKNNASANPSFGNDKKLAEAQRDEQIRNQIKLLQEQKITQAEFDSDMVAIQNDYLKKVGDAFLTQFDRYAGYAKKAFDTVDGLEKAAAERTINRIQRQIDANNKLKEAETTRINTSTLSETQKAAALITLDAKTAASNEALQRKQRDEKIKEAEFDKAKGILNITVSTAEAIMKAVAASPMTGGLPFSAIAAATGASELAIAIATPIPKYAAGTEHSKRGYALTDERGPEGYITPRGEAFIGNNRPTVRFLEEGTKIIPHEKLREYHSLQLLPRMQQDRELERKIDKLTDAILETGRDTVSAIRRNKPIAPPATAQDPGPAFWAMIHKSCG